jgi:hypothetical protein
MDILGILGALIVLLSIVSIGYAIDLYLNEEGK